MATLVAYFSITGVTRKVAERLAKGLNADIHEILTELPYTEEDLNENEKNSRARIEMRCRGRRPVLKTIVPDISIYDTIFVGFPIWCHLAPTVINSFLEDYKLRRATVIPFATSRSSGFGNIMSELYPSVRGGRILIGKRFDANATVEELVAFAKERLSDLEGWTYGEVWKPSLHY